MLGVVLFGSLPGAILLAGAGAYAATKSDAVKSAGEATAKVYSKAVELEQEYEALLRNFHLRSRRISFRTAEESGEVWPGTTNCTSLKIWLSQSN